MQFPRDIWSEIVKHVDLADFKAVSLTCILLHQLIAQRRIKYLRILLRWRNKTRNPSLNLNQYIAHRPGSTVTFESMVDGCLEYFVDLHLIQLPNFLKKTIKNTNARERIRYHRATYNLDRKYGTSRYVNIIPDPTINLNYEATDLKLTSLSNIHAEFDDIENGSYSWVMISLILILSALGIENIIDINAICNDRSTQYVTYNPHFNPDLTPYQARFQQIKDRKDVQYLLYSML